MALQDPFHHRGGSAADKSRPAPTLRDQLLRRRRSARNRADLFEPAHSRLPVVDRDSSSAAVAYLPRLQTRPLPRRGAYAHTGDLDQPAQDHRLPRCGDDPGADHRGTDAPDRGCGQRLR